MNVALLVITIIIICIVFGVSTRYSVSRFSQSTPKRVFGWASVPYDPANGCGNGCNLSQFLVGLPGVNIASIREACNDHDRCYHSHGTSQKTCDRGLLYAILNTAGNNKILLVTYGLVNSFFQAFIYWIAVKYGGKAAYNYGQRKALEAIKNNETGRVYTNIVGGPYVSYGPKLFDSNGGCPQNCNTHADCEDNEKVACLKLNKVCADVGAQNNKCICSLEDKDYKYARKVDNNSYWDLS